PGVRRGRQRQPLPDTLGYGADPDREIWGRGDLVRREADPEERAVCAAGAAGTESGSVGLTSVRSVLFVGATGRIAENHEHDNQVGVDIGRCPRHHSYGILPYTTLRVGC